MPKAGGSETKWRSSPSGWANLCASEETTTILAVRCIRETTHNHNTTCATNRDGEDAASVSNRSWVRKKCPKWLVANMSS